MDKRPPRKMSKREEISQDDWQAKFFYLVDDIRRIEILVVMNVMLEFYKSHPDMGKETMLELLFELYNDRPEITEKLARLLFENAQKDNPVSTSRDKLD